jgi:hypothetical protein
MSHALLAFLIGLSLDTGSTMLQMHRGCEEANPLLRAAHITTPTRIGVYSGAMGVGVTLALGHTHKSRSKTAQAIAWSLAGVHLGSAVWNLNQTCKRN